MRGSTAKACLCSARESGSRRTTAGLLALRRYARPGADVRDVLGLDDHVFTIKLSRTGADCLCVLAFAREVAALTRSPLRAIAPHRCGRPSTDFIR